MRHGQLTREQAIARVGLEAVERVERLNCEPTSRLQTDGDDDTEWCSTSTLFYGEGYNSDYAIIAYYYTTPEQDKIMADHDCDGSYIDWEINGYDIE